MKQIEVHTDDRPSTTHTIFVADMTPDAINEWYDIVDTNGNHWMVHRNDVAKILNNGER